jgi:ATP-dependent Clp protease adaptor protein ClpS
MATPKTPSEPPRPPRSPNSPGEHAPDHDEQVDVKDRPKSDVPKRYRVIFHNDDYTTQEFVIVVLVQFFHKTETEAFHIMITVHKKGSAVAGLYPRDVAETKCMKVIKHARECGMPLMLTAEPE